MNTSVSAYTNLESLLLFQCLHAYGVAPSVFGRISDLLKQNPDITTHKYFQPGRLSPDALRNFYLERLKRELEHEQASDADALHGQVANSAKRKRHSPSLPTVQESLQHQHLIPKLVTKLYASYRRELTEQIRADEDRYERLQLQLKSIDHGEWDDQLREKANGRTPVSSRSPTLPRKSPHLAQKPLQPAQQHLPTQNGQSSPVQRKKQTATPQQQQPPAQSPRLQHPSNYNGAPYPNISPFPPPAPVQGPQNTQSQPSPHPSQSRSPPPASPGPQYQYPQSLSYGPNGVPPYGPPGPHPQHVPPHQHFPPQQSPGPHSPSMHHPQQQQRAHFPHHGHQPYPPLQPQIAQPPPQAGFMLPPFQVAPQDPSRVHHQPTVPTQYPQVSTPTGTRQPSRPILQTPGAARPGVPPVHPLVTQARNPLSTPTNLRSPVSALGTPVSARSLWKRSSLGEAPTLHASPRPEVEPLDDVPPLIRPKQTPPKAKAQRKSRTKGKGKDAEQDHSVADTETPQSAKQLNDAEEESMLEPETRSGRSRRKAPAKRARPGSLASSRAGGSVRDRSRSQSILSHTDTIAADNESQAGNRIKSERGNSVDAIEEEGSAETPSHMSTRRRGAAATSAPLSTRRKRNAREASLDEQEDHMFTTGSKQVSAAAAASDNPTGSPGGATGGVVELPVTVDNVPPKSIVNAAQLEKELMRMFVNAVMFNPGEEGVVNDARDMFQTVQGLVSTWRDVERHSGRVGNEDTPTVDEEDVPTASKRRKI
ncbi:hypothetical protein P3342_005545 [Pyrenophora teres f. teres]|nr:hypothetical protein P3342_005545 [Pyrenophora teres f. teres]